jgi:DNA repair exonuclease SbcCD nuclease subunit
VEFAAEQIGRFRGPAILLPGNHDPLDAGRLYDRHDLEAMARNLRIIRDPRGQLLHLEDLDLVVWGRGYFDSEIGFRPLDGLPKRLDARWHIAMGHGHYVSTPADRQRSLPIEQEELAAADWDYLALGHWERHCEVSAGTMTAVYSGAPCGLGGGDHAGWATIVDFDAQGVTYAAHPVDPARLVASA